MEELRSDQEAEQIRNVVVHGSHLSELRFDRFSLLFCPSRSLANLSRLQAEYTVRDLRPLMKAVLAKHLSSDQEAKQVRRGVVQSSQIGERRFDGRTARQFPVRPPHALRLQAGAPPRGLHSLVRATVRSLWVQPHSAWVARRVHTDATLGLVVAAIGANWARPAALEVGLRALTGRGALCRRGGQSLGLRSLRLPTPASQSRCRIARTSHATVEFRVPAGEVSAAGVVLVALEANEKAGFVVEATPSDDSPDLPS